MKTAAPLKANSSELTPQEVVRILLAKKRLLVQVTIACTVLATGYAFLMERNWEASQGLVVRREVNTSSSITPGKFTDLYEMRTFQETILELVRSRQVISSTLRTVHRGFLGDAGYEPTDEDINSFRKKLNMTPPGGAEFGKTEIFYLSVQNRNRDQAIRYVAELCRQLDNRLRRLSDDRSESLVVELQEQVDLASAAHQERTRILTEFESSVGADLGELRMLNAAFSGQSDLRQQAIALEAESRQASLQARDSEQLLKVLRKVQLDPEQLVALPNSLLTSQPTLRQLKDGLVAAQLRVARLAGIRTAEHPHVVAAKDSVAQIREDLRSELRVALQGVQVELELSQNRAKNLRQQSNELQSRLSNLAVLRAEYENHVSAAENSRLVLDQALKQLGEVQATHAAAKAASLVSTIDSPETGPYPIGLGRSQVVLLGGLGGCFLAVAWIFITSTSFASSRSHSASQETTTRTPTTNPNRNGEHSLETDESWSPVLSPTQKSKPGVAEQLTHAVTSGQPTQAHNEGLNSLGASTNGAIHAN